MAEKPGTLPMHRQLGYCIDMVNVLGQFAVVTVGLEVARGVVDASTMEHLIEDLRKCAETADYEPEDRARVQSWHESMSRQLQTLRSKGLA